jgi:multidrug efflux pump subunit AcrA (membrane-fusion protein)
MTQRTSSILAGIALVVGLILPACSRGTRTAPAEPADAIPVTVATVAMADVGDTFEAGGVVQARTTATLMARILAPVREVRAGPGDRVRVGQVLIVLDGRDLAAQARRARAEGVSADQDVIAAGSERQAAEATLALARSTHARIAGLHAKRSATSQELDDATAALRAAEARAAGAPGGGWGGGAGGAGGAAGGAHAAVSGVEGARAASEAADTTETFSRIAAPFGGVVTEKMVEPGNMAAPGTPLMRIEDTRSFRLDVRVDESRIAQITRGATVSVSLDAGPNGAPRVTSGKVTEVGRAVDADARAFLVKIALPADAGLRSGMFGRAHFASRPRRALTVPAGTLVHRGQVTSVLVVENDIARVRLVSVSGNEVLAGLSDGDVVIVAPPPTLTDGRRVKVGGR